jgi:hypothetical protein
MALTRSDYEIFAKTWKLYLKLKIIYMANETQCKTALSYKKPSFLL